LKTFDGTDHQAELGQLTVVENRASTSKRTIEIDFVRLRTTASTPGSPIVFIAGGPGVPGAVMGRIPPFFKLFDRLRDIGDVILLDQRGTGMSKPALDCPAAESAPVDVIESAKKAADYMANVNQRCVNRWRAEGVDVSAYNAVLAAVIGPDNALTLPDTWDVQIEKLSRLTGSDFTGTVMRVLDAVEKKPLELTVNDRLRRSTVKVRIGRIALQTILQGIGDGRAATSTMDLFSNIAKGDYESLAKRAEGLYNSISGTAIFPVATSCADGASPQRRARVAEQANGSMVGDVNLQMRPEICRLYVPADRRPESLPRVMATPTLMLSGTLDPVAPPFQAEAVRWRMSDAPHIVVENAFHDTLPMTDVQNVVHDFLKGVDVRGRVLRFERPQLSGHQ